MSSFWFHVRRAPAAAALLAAVLAGGLTAACTPGNDITAAEADVVATLFDDTFDFGSVSTYAMPDSIVHLTGDPDEADSELLTRDFDAQILAQMAENLDALGWTRLPASPADPNNPPDVFVLLAATATANFSMYYYPWYPYWCWYYPGWGYGGGWGWYYPSYPTVTYAYTLGTLAVTLFDPEGAVTADELMPVRWVAAINGVLDDTAASKQQRITRAIDQAFDQSPYLSGN